MYPIFKTGHAQVGTGVGHGLVHGGDGTVILHTASVCRPRGAVDPTSLILYGQNLTLLLRRVCGLRPVVAQPPLSSPGLQCFGQEKESAFSWITQSFSIHSVNSTPLSPSLQECEAWKDGDREDSIRGHVWLRIAPSQQACFDSRKKKAACVIPCPYPRFGLRKT